MLTIEVTYKDGRTEIIDHPDDSVLDHLAEVFAVESVKILKYVPSERRGDEK